MRRLAIALLLNLLLLPLAHADVRKSVVQVFNQSREVNFQYPWQNGNIGMSSGSGVIIAGNRILTNAHVVDNSLQLQVRKVGSDKKYAAFVAYISDERDLALLQVEDQGFFDGTEVIELDGLPQLAAEVTTYGFPVGGTELAITRGIVSRIDFDYYAHSGYPNLVCQIDAAINPGASGGPAIVSGKLVGLNFQGLQNANNVGYIIPAPVIQTFLKDIQDGKVNGVPEIAFSMQSMENEQLRKRYHLENETGGVLITSLSGLEKELGLLKVGDVLVSMDGVPVGTNGTVPFSTADRINSNVLIAQRQPGDHLPLGIIRDGKRIDIDYPLSYTLKDARIVPGHQSNLTPDYEVIGGLVIVELTEDVMREWKMVPPAIEQLRYEYRRTGKADIDRLLMVSSVLPDDINKGYEETRFSLLSEVNGKPVSNLKQVRQQLADKGEYITLKFSTHDGIAVFSRAELQQRMPVIAERYGLPQR